MGGQRGGRRRHELARVYPDWYTRDRLDGNTALCTRAADIAVSHGIVVVNSAGNEGTSGLVAPADGDSVLAIGAVDRAGAIASFSSRGPTADGRIKPDFAAMGVGVRSVSGPAGYGSYNGTSYAAPIVAGVCALLLELHPDWTPMAMRDSAPRHLFPKRGSRQHVWVGDPERDAERAARRIVNLA